MSGTTPDILRTYTVLTITYPKLRHVDSFNGRAALEAMRREFGQRDVAYVVTQIRAVVHTAWTGNFLQFKLVSYVWK